MRKVEKVGVLSVKCYVLFIFVVLLDQISKFLAPRLGFSLYLNHGGAFGLFGEWAWLQTAAHWLLAAFLVFWIFLKKGVWGRWGYWGEVGFWLFVAGGVGNTLDRLFFGGVRDFIRLPLLPSFNLADVSISAGAILLCYGLFLKPKTGDKKSD